MIERFQDAPKAIVYLCQAFRAHFKEPHAEVTFYPDGVKEQRSMLVDIEHLPPVLERFCHRFPEATAMLLPMEGIAPVAGIQCHCPSEWRKTGRCHCRLHEHRAIVTVFLCHSMNERPSDSLKRNALDLLQQVAHDFQSEQKISRSQPNMSKLHRIL